MPVRNKKKKGSEKQRRERASKKRAIILCPRMQENKNWHNRNKRFQQKKRYEED